MLLTKKNKNKVLIIVSKWPNAKTPYLTILYRELLNRNQNYSLYILKKGSLNDCLGLLNKKVLKTLLKRSIFQNPIKIWSISLLKFIFWVLTHPLSYYKFKTEFTKSGYSNKQAIGQIWRHCNILNSDFNLLYFNALQSIKHLNSQILFPGTKVIASSRGKDFDLDMSRMKLSLDHVENLHVISNYLKNKALELDFNEEKITVIPPANLNPIGKHIRKREISDDIINICTVSRFTWEKGMIYSLRAVARLINLYQKKKVRYFLIGDGPEMDFLKIEAIRLNIVDNLVWTGWLNQDELKERLNLCDIYLLMSISEGFNNSVIQAQSLGIPCVVSNAGGLPENVINGTTGIVVDKYNYEEAGNALLEICNNDELRKSFSKNAIDHVATNFNIENQIMAYKEWIDNALKSTNT